jgi:tetratricopeptide (TPR) repeat protein/transcriptional regulator with XRE-family HTH domain
MRPVPEPGSTFGALLKQLRTQAGLTQEELARAATVSYRSISDLERGINQSARGQTARLLADALNLRGQARARFETAARGGSPLTDARSGPAAALPGALATATRTLPRDTRAFTGREPELSALLTAATEAAKAGRVVSIHSIGGMAGVGKSTFAVHAAHQLAPWFPDGQIFLPLHAHTPGQRPVDPAEALASLLLTAGIAASQIPPRLDERVRLWRDHLAGRRLLLVLDDAAGHDQVLPLLPGTAGSLVLITSRKHLTALEDASSISLDTLPADQAAELLVSLASRPDLQAADAQVRQLAQLCGHLPLAIGMLARQLQHHPAWSSADLVSELSTARDRLELMHAENVSVSAAFDLSYQDLAADLQRLFRRLSLHPGTEIDVYAAAALDGASLADTRRRLGSLYDHYLLAEPARGHYRLHDLVREHARALGNDDPAADRDQALSRLAGYYLHQACAADHYLARRAPVQPPADLPAPAELPVLASRADAISWLERERPNLHALILDSADSGRPRPAIVLATATHAFLRFAGYWDQAAAQNEIAVELARSIGDQHAQARARTNLGDVLLARRDYPAARASLSTALADYVRLADRAGEAAARTALASACYLAGDNQAAAEDLTMALALYRELHDHLGEALAISRLASVQLITGDYAAASDGLAQALGLYRGLGDHLGEAQALNDLGAVQHALGDQASARTSLEQALARYRQLDDRIGAANALLDLAGVQQAGGDLEAAIAGLAAARALYQELGDRLGTANVLNQLGAVQLASGDLTAAAGTLQQALDLYRDLGDPAGAAQALVGLGNVALAGAAAGPAADRFRQASAIAREVASPPLAAQALEGIGHSALLQGRTADAIAAFTESLRIYQQLGSPAADQVRAALADLTG